MLNATAVYCRVSTKEQSIESQKLEIMRWLTAHGLTEADVTWYVDHETGTTLAREAFNRLEDDIFRGRVTTVIVARLDRVSRKLYDGIRVLGEWAERGVRIVSVTQDIDLSGAMGRLIAAIMLGVAEIETTIRKERQMAGIAAAKARGVYKDRRVTGPGRSKKAKPARAHELRAKGLTAPEIATAMGVSLATVWRYLSCTTQTSAAGSPSPSSSSECLLGESASATP